VSDLSRRIAALSPERQALLKSRLGAGSRPDPRAGAEPLAVVGVGCRFPGGADTPERFWQLLRDGVDAITEVPADRWDAAALYDADPNAPGKMSTRWGGFLDGLDRFDPYFFGISPRETTTLDPQQRLLLEVAWEALEDAGQTRERLAGSRTGVYVGTHANDYSWMLFSDRVGLDAYASTGTAHSIVANRLSYVFDLRGPSVAVDTACSSSLVAVHLACQGLRNRECDLAVAGGVNVLLSPLWSVAIAKLGMLSPTGRCKTFDASADGMVRSEGCGVVVLKRLADAIADGDHIWARIRGSAINQDGRTNGLTAPNGLAQQAMLRDALANAGVDPADVSYVEAHGTGTPLGDPIEVEALVEVLGRSGARPCWLGSVKTNLGHLEGAAGIAGLIKVLLLLRHGVVPPPVHFRALNPHISLGGSRIAVPVTSQVWPRDAATRYAGVSAFGFGGSNAHVVLEEAPAVEVPAPPPGPYLLPLSARGADGLRTLTRSHREWLESASATTSAVEMCRTAALRRSHHPHRLAVVGASAAELGERLLEAETTLDRALAAPTSAPVVAFVFSGQGTQAAGMGRELAEREPVFRRALQECDALVRAEAGWSLLDVLADPAPATLARTAVAQPAIFAIQVGLVALLRSWGVEPDAVTGHSMGEVAAAHTAGVLELSEAVRVIVHRARLMERATGLGRMVSVSLNAADAARAIAGQEARLSVAALNGPDTTVIAGAPDALEPLVRDLERRGVACRWLGVDYAFHSPQMDAFCEPLVRELGGLAPRAARLRLVSTVTGEPAGAADFGAAYWGRNIREPVRFMDAVGTLAARGTSTFVEIGPQPVLGGAIAQSLAALGRDGVALASLRRGQPEAASMLRLLGRLWERGRAVDWAALYGAGGRHVRLPLTPWQRETCPPRVPRTAAGPATPSLAGGHPLLARRLATATPIFETSLDGEAPGYLADHRIHGVPVLSGTALAEMALAAGAAARRGSVTLTDLILQRPVVLEPGRAVQVVVSTATDDAEAVRIFSRMAGADGEASEWTLHATARVRAEMESPPADPPALDALRARCAVEIAGAAHDDRLRGLGADFGPSYRVVRRLWRGTGEALAEVVLPSELADDAGGYFLHPALLDGCLRPVVALAGEDGGLPVPIGVEALRTFRRPRGPVWSWMRAHEHAGSLHADVLILDGAGDLVAELRGVTFRAARPGEATQSAAAALAYYEVAWRRAPRPSVTPRSAGRWLILADEGGVAAKLALALEAGGHRVTVAPTPAGRPGVDALLARADAPGSRWTDIVHLAGIDVAVDDRADAETVQASAVGACAKVLDLVQGLARPGVTSRLWLLTRGAQATVADEALSVVQAPLWGLGCVVALEHPELRPTLVDLDPSANADVVATLVAELGATDGEQQVALRGAERFAARLQSGARRDEAQSDGQTPLRLDIHERGVLDNLAWVPAPAAPVDAGRVRIHVRAVGLNFRDVLNALGMYPGDPGQLGNECVGEVVTVGAGVQDLALGDRVMAVADGAFATTVVTDARLAVRVPAGLETEAAATVPIAFLTARYALREIAALAPGQRVLIHAAAGGVGLAAVQIARRAGAEIFATAGSPDKRALLASLGVAHVLDSRSLDFADEVLARTRGEGVDVVLNSLAGEFIPRSLAVLRRGGCFVEIGRRGIWAAADVAAVRPDVRYHVLYLGDSFTREPARIQSMLTGIAAELEAGSLTPLPHRVYPAARAVDAFRFMAQARHVGKIVVTPPAGTRSTLPVRGDATYLVTGGLGALGLHTAEWLCAQGARSLVLMGRSDPSPEARAAVARLEAKGALVRIASGDVARAADVDRVLADARGTLPAVRGIVHAAGVVEDAVLARQTRAGLAAVMAPKVAGAWNLHRAAEDLDLDFVVFYSSIAAVLGSPGQANYAAGNAFLDGLAAYRRGQGRPGLAVQWGPWSGAGMAARLGERDRERWTAKGVGALAPAEGLATLGQLLTSGSAAPAHAAIVRVDWTRYVAALPSGAPPLLADLLRPAQAPAIPAGVAPGRPRLLQLLDEAPPARKRHVVLSHVREQVAKVLQLPPSQTVDADRGLKDMGLDSLMAVELRNRLQASLGRSLPTTLAFDQPTASAITDYLLRDALGVEDARAERAAADDHALADEVRALTDDEAASLLLDELARGGRGESQGLGHG